MIDSSRCIDWSTRLYRFLLKAYPVEFREAFGDEMTLIFREMAAEAWHRHGLSGLIFIWFRILADFSVSAPHQCWLAGNRKTFERSTVPMIHKSFRLSLGKSGMNFHWTPWRIAAVVLMSFSTLVAAIVVFAVITQGVFFAVDGAFRRAHLTAFPWSMRTTNMIGHAFGILGYFATNWLGARLIKRFIGRPSLGGVQTLAN
jgi:hypothetical protein